VYDDVVRLRYTHGYTRTVDYQFFGDLEAGIRTTLYDWWLSDIDYFLDCEAFMELRDMTKESIISDLIDLWETRQDVDCNGTLRELSAKGKLSYDVKRNK
jgi:hypothetical protein